MSNRPSRAAYIPTDPVAAEPSGIVHGPSTPTGEALAKHNYECAMIQYRLGKLLQEPTMTDASRWTPGPEGFTETYGE